MYESNAACSQTGKLKLIQVQYLLAPPLALCVLPVQMFVCPVCAPCADVRVLQHIGDPTASLHLPHWPRLFSLSLQVDAQPEVGTAQPYINHPHLRS